MTDSERALGDEPESRLGTLPRLTRGWRRGTVEWRRRVATLLGSLALGLIAVIFAGVGETAQHLFQRLLAFSPWAPLVVTPLAFVGVAFMTRRLWPTSRASGIPQVMAAARHPASAAKSELVSLPTAGAKIVGTLVMLAAGGSVGREGPTVQVSAAVMVAIHRWLRVPVSAGVLIAGGAAGVAAAFNTPLAGVAFAIEELASAFQQRVAVLVMMAVMISGLVSLGISGDYVYFGAMSQRLSLETALIAAPVAGVLGGLAGGFFAKCLVVLGSSEHPLFKAMRERPLLLALGCGIVAALAGVLSGGQSWGTGYGATRMLLGGGDAPWYFGPARFAATVAAAWSGAPGGIFAPSLSVGAGLGHLLAPLFASDSAGAVVMLGMLGYFTGVVRAPLTAIIIVAEMTADRSMILPLFATALIADQVSAMVCREKLYHALSHAFMGHAGDRATDAKAH